MTQAVQKVTTMGELILGVVATVIVVMCLVPVMFGRGISQDEEREGYSS